MFHTGREQAVYSVAVYGTIGAEKSTFCSKLTGVFAQLGKTCFFVPEYIDGVSSGDCMLARWVSGGVTLTEFHQYVLACY